MLRAKDCPKRNSVNNFVQWISIATIIAIAIGATSIRSHAQQSEPTQTTTNLDQKSNKSDPKRRQPFYASLIAEKGCAVAVIRIAELLRRPGMQQYRDGFEEEIFASFKSLLKDHPDLVINIEQIELLACTPKVIIDEQDEPKQDRLMFGSDRILIRTIDAFDWRQFLTTLLPNAVEIPHKGRAYFKLPVVPALGPQQLFVHVPDDRTLLLLMGEEATKKLVARPFDSPTEWKWAKQWKALDQGLITFAFDNRNAHWLDERGKEGEWRTIGAALVDEPQFLCVAFDWQAETNRLTFQGQAICERKAQVDKFTGTLASISKLAKDGLINKRPNVKTDVDTKAFAFADSLLKSVNIRVGEAANNRAKIDVRLEAILVSELIQAMVDQGTNEKGS